MAATSIKIPLELKDRVAAAAAAAGLSPHAFMLDAIEQQTSLAEARRAFLDEARAARATMDATGLGYEAAEVHAYLSARARGQRARRPEAGRWRD